jgi:hypothetical protein
MNGSKTSRSTAFSAWDRKRIGTSGADGISTTTAAAATIVPKLA